MRKVYHIARIRYAMLVAGLLLLATADFLLAPIAKPIISHIARETLERTLASVRGRFQS